MNQRLGNVWLREHFNLDVRALTQECWLGSRPKVVSSQAGGWESFTKEYFTRNYLPDETPLAHVEFALKYDHLHLELLRAVFERIPAEEVSAWVGQQPTGKWARRIGYLYELLTGRDLHPKTLGVGGNYAALLNPDKYVCAARPVKVPHWRIEDNLLGDRHFCPIVRLTEAVQEGARIDVAARLQALQEQYSPAIYRRAVGYLYEKETRKSYEIERESPTPDREARFVAALHDAGRARPEDALGMARLVGLQNIIVDARYAQSAYRDDQNYIGETLPNYQQRIHFIPPPPEFVDSLMCGLGGFLLRSAGSPALCRAAVAAFGFVFIHPFDDGNGRLHRFLIHDVLAMDGFVPEGMVLPVSAWMLKHMALYDRCLESFSEPLLDKIRRSGGYTLNEQDQLTVTNPAAIETYYRYPDMTAQVEYLVLAIKGALDEELIPEMEYLQILDRARVALRQIVDMPDRKLDKLIMFFHQNRGVLSKNKRGLYPEIRDDEIVRLTRAYQEVVESVTGAMEAGNG